METFIAVCSFIGTWLLVAGPIYQAALELKEENIEQEHLDTTREKVPHPHASSWWWLIPPAKIILEQRLNKQYRQDFIAALPDEDVEILISFINKASAWVLVATGGLLLAISETYGLIHLLKWNIIWFWTLIVILSTLSVANTALRISRNDRVVKAHK